MDLPKDVFYTDECIELKCEFSQITKGEQPQWIKDSQLLQLTSNIHILKESNGKKTFINYWILKSRGYSTIWIKSWRFNCSKFEHH